MYFLERVTSQNSEIILLTDIYLNSNIFTWRILFLIMWQILAKIIAKFSEFVLEEHFVIMLAKYLRLKSLIIWKTSISHFHFWFLDSGEVVVHHPGIHCCNLYSLSLELLPLNGRDVYKQNAVIHHAEVPLLSWTST